MGSNFSSRSDVYVHHFVNPRVQERQEQVMVRMMAVPGETHMLFNERTDLNPFEHLISKKDEGQHAIITGIYALYICNESRHDITMSVSGLFPTGNKPPNEDVCHIDDSGEMKILCPAKFNKALEGNDCILYKPRLKDEVIRCYAGLDNAILKDESVPLNEGGDATVVMELAHPLTHFIITNAELLQPAAGDVERHESHIVIKRAFLVHARKFYADNIHGDLHMTRFEETKMNCVVPRSVLDDIQKKKNHPSQLPNVTVMLQINYYLITPGEPKMKHTQIKV